MSNRIQSQQRRLAKSRLERAQLVTALGSATVSGKECELQKRLERQTIFARVRGRSQDERSTTDKA